MGVLNRILYGPPGTGKTFNTIRQAVDSCRSKGDHFNGCKAHPEGHDASCYDCAKEAYGQLKEEGRIEFVTFHQSYGYEEFIEGIRAETRHDEDGSSIISYEVKPGVFKRIAKEASKKNKQSQSSVVKKDFSDVFQDAVVAKVSKGAVIQITTLNSSFVIKKVKERTIYFDNGAGSETTFNIKTLQKMYEEGSNKIITGGMKGYYEGLLKYLNTYSQVPESFDMKNFVLIIDEINRGNMSKIFGELITLIEDDKRIGASNELRVRLPVSGDEFGVPKNLHIIATMNTADRSIAMMDTALRRRFEFKEMMPNPCLLHVEGLDSYLSRISGSCTMSQWEDMSYWEEWRDSDDWNWNKDYPEEDMMVDGVNLRRMLYAINQRIEVLYDREHTIGHAYFMSLDSNSGINDLASIFANKVIPLLSEYFFEDWEKIRMVLGDNQKKDSANQFIVENTNVDYQKLFGSNMDDAFLDERKVFERNPIALNHAASYIGIYQDIQSKIVHEELSDE